MKMLELFLDEMEKYFPKLVPIMLEVLSDKSPADKTSTIIIRKRIFKCFIYMNVLIVINADYKIKFSLRLNCSIQLF